MKHKHVGKFRILRLMSHDAQMLEICGVCSQSHNFYRLVQPIGHGISACQSNTTKMFLFLMYVILVLVWPQARGAWAHNRLHKIFGTN